MILRAILIQSNGAELAALTFDSAHTEALHWPMNAGSGYLTAYRIESADGRELRGGALVPSILCAFGVAPGLQPSAWEGL